MFVDQQQNDRESASKDGNTAHHEGPVGRALSQNDKILKMFKLFKEFIICKESCCLQIATTLVTRLAIIIKRTIIASDVYEKFAIVNDFQGGNGRGYNNECHSLQ